MLEQIPGTREGEGEVEFETTGRSPMLEIRVKRDVLAKYNLHSGDVNQVIAAALGGQTVGTLMEGNRRFEIVVRLAERNVKTSTPFVRCRCALATRACFRWAHWRTLNALKRRRRSCAIPRSGEQR